ncbi:hypothetical protein HKX48_006954 [Thoreauomyces humboldtii]|nr:hypothetical protein HKX48_006954 [Thoreauomyces humboldtii]
MPDHRNTGTAVPVSAETQSSPFVSSARLIVQIAPYIGGLLFLAALHDLPKLTRAEKAERSLYGWDALSVTLAGILVDIYILGSSLNVGHMKVFLFMDLGVMYRALLLMDLEVKFQASMNGLHSFGWSRTGRTSAVVVFLIGIVNLIALWLFVPSKFPEARPQALGPARPLGDKTWGFGKHALQFLLVYGCARAALG